MPKALHGVLTARKEIGDFCHVRREGYTQKKAVSGGNHIPTQKKGCVATASIFNKLFYRNFFDASYVSSAFKFGIQESF